MGEKNREILVWGARFVTGSLPGSVSALSVLLCVLLVWNSKYPEVGKFLHRFYYR